MENTPGSSTNREIIEQGFHAVNVRLDDMRGQMLMMHHENTARLDKINGKVGRAHELIAALQEAVATLKSEFIGIRKRWHDFRDSLQDYVRATPDGAPLTQKQFGIVLTLIVATATIAVAVTMFIVAHQAKP